MVLKTFTTFSKHASHKAPSFFDSAYHLRNYTQLVSPDLFTSNTSRDKTSGGNGSYPKYQYGIYSYSLQLDPYTSSLIYHNHNNNNNNGNNNSALGINNHSSNPYNNVDEEFIINNAKNNKFVQDLNTRGHTLAVINNSSITNSNININNPAHNVSNQHHNHHTVPTLKPPIATNYATHFLDSSLLSSKKINHELLQTAPPRTPLVITSKRAYATLADSADDVLKKSKLSSATASVTATAASTTGATKNTLARRSENYTALKLKHLQQLKIAIGQASTTNTLQKTLLTEALHCVESDNYTKIYPLYQALRRNELPLTVAVFNIVLHSIMVREIPGESIESKLTNILNIYSDMISLQLQPDVDSYQLVVSSLLQGAFQSYDLYLHNNSTEVTTDDDGKVLRNKIDNGANYFKLALEIFIASNFSRNQKFHQSVYEMLLSGLNVFNYKFREASSFRKFLNILNVSSHFVKNEVYYINLVRYGVNLEHVEDKNNDKQSGNKLAFVFTINIYNEYKLKAIEDKSSLLMAHQFNVYAVFLHSLCQLNKVNIATKTLDKLLISFKDGAPELAYTEAVQAANSFRDQSPASTRSNSPTNSTSSSLFSEQSTQSSTMDNNNSFEEDFTSGPVVVNQTSELTKVIIFYLSALLDLNMGKSLQLFEKFSRFDLISIKENPAIVGQYFINALLKSCEVGDLDTCNYIFQNFIDNKDLKLFNLNQHNKQRGHFINEANANHKTPITSSNERINYLLKAIISSSSTSSQNGLIDTVNGRGANTLAKALNSFLRLSIEQQNLRDVDPYLQFENGNNANNSNNVSQLSENSKQLVNYLDEESVCELVAFMMRKSYPFEHVLGLLESVAEQNITTQHASSNFDFNALLTRLLNRNELLDKQDASSNVFNIFKSPIFFSHCGNEFSIKLYVAECERTSFNNNRYFGYIEVWFGFWNVLSYLQNATTNGANNGLSGSAEWIRQQLISNQQIIQKNFTSLLEEFENLDNYYLQRNINIELANNCGGNNDQFQAMSDREKNFYIQLNIFKQFKEMVGSAHVVFQSLVGVDADVSSAEGVEEVKLN